MRLVWKMACLLGLFARPAFADPGPLPALAANPARVSVSGLSSGGFMAAQYAVAYSRSIMGAGIVAGGPYNCAAIYGMFFLQMCMQGSPSGKTSWKAAKGFASSGLIDPVANIKAQRIYLFSGTQDQVVSPKVMKGVKDFYRAAGLPAANLRYMNAVPAGHAFISTNIGAPSCGTNASPYIDQCTVEGTPYDQPQMILSQIYGPLKPKATTLSAAPIAFDQRSYGGDQAQMAPTGYVYIPASCRGGAAPCAVHVVFHGCVQSAQEVGDDVYAKLGYNQWADSNGIIMLYPQVNRSLANPQGCWDWWGYSGFNPQLRSAVQPAAIHAMIARLEEAAP